MHYFMLGIFHKIPLKYTDIYGYYYALNMKKIMFYKYFWKALKNKAYCSFAYPFML